MQKDTKFKIEGEIQGHEQNDANRVIKPRKNYKTALLIFVILTVLLAGLSAFLWFKGHQESKDKASLEEQSENAASYRDSMIMQKATSDSLYEANRILSERVARMQEFTPDNDGVFFEVQIGNFKDFNLDEYLNEMAHLRQEKSDGTNKFLLGKFRSYKKAMLFENDLKRMGMPDVFIKGRINGQLTSKEEALEYLRKNKG